MLLGVELPPPTLELEREAGEDLSLCLRCSSSRSG